MKKRVLSLLMALALCFTMLPTAALAQQTGAADVYTTGEDTAVQGKRAAEAVRAAQALIDALPDEVTADNAEEIAAQLANLNETLVALTEEQLAALDMARYEALCAALVPQVSLTAERGGEHADHPICGATHKDIGDHTGECADVTWTELTVRDGQLYIGENAAEHTSKKYVFAAYVLPEGSYYLGEDIAPDDVIRIEGTVNLCLNGHRITKVGSDKNQAFAGTIMSEGAASFSLCDCRGGGTITHEEGALGRGIKFSSTTFNMYGGEISGNYEDVFDKVSQSGGGVSMDGGTFTMYGGKITGNHAASRGGGVYVSSGSFTMYNGVISDNTAGTNGGGILAIGSVTIKGGTISDNVTDGNGGGVYVYNNNLTLADDAIITGNAATKGNGGGVYYNSTSSSYELTVSDTAKIEKNSAANGGGIYADKGVLKLTGGTIGDNTVTGSGAGVYAAADCTLTMNGDARIAGNKATGNSARGGGVYVAGTCNMSGNAAITGNSAAYGGVYVNSGAAFTMNGGSITANTAKYGGGVWTATAFEVSGAPKIIDNTDSTDSTGSTKNNVYLSLGTTITIADALAPEARIGVTTGHENSIAPGKYVTVATGAEKGCTADNFSADKGGSCAIKAEGDNVNLYNGLPQEHPICGAAHKDINGHTGACADVTWTAWDGVSDITYDANNTAYVYLRDNAERDSALEIANGYTLYLCLSGHSLTKNKTGKSVIKVGDNATLSLCDCSDAQSGKLTHGTTARGSKYTGHGVSLGYRSTFNMYGGSITGNRADTGGGVSLASEYSYAKFNMYGGSITNNAATNGDGGGGVHNLFGTFTMYGGSITGNSADTRYGGGGVYLARMGEFVMKGGEITGNTAKNGGGVYTAVNGNTGLTVSGDAAITGNSNTAGKDENVYLVSGKTIEIGADGLGEKASIGVTTADTITTGSYVTVANGAENGYTDGNIFSDAGGAYCTLQEGDLVNLYNGLPHRHPICGEVCTHMDANGDPIHPIVEWIAVSDASDITDDLAEGNYYLAGPVALGQAWSPENDIHLCLNGQTLERSGAFNTVTVKQTLTLCDCDTLGRGTLRATGGTSACGVCVDSHTNGEGNFEAGIFDMYGGTITGVQYGVKFGTYRGIFNMYGGTIKDSGTGVCMKGYTYSSATFNMYGGTIENNGTGSEDVGGVYVATCTFNMSGGVITGNSKSERTSGAGGVYVTGGRFTMSGDAEIRGNRVTIKESTNAGLVNEGAGGVYVKSGTFRMSGNARITDNTVVNNSSKVMAGGVYMTDAASMSVSGAASVTGNTGSNIYLPTGKAIAIAGALEESASFGVTTADIPADSFATVATGAAAGDEDCFFDESGRYRKEFANSSVVFLNVALHDHALCGAAAADCGDGHADELWLPLTYDAATHTLYCGATAIPSSIESRPGAENDDYHRVYKLPTGNYYLADNIELTGGEATKGTTTTGGALKIAEGTDVKLCLNGKTLSTAMKLGDVVDMDVGAALTLSDCKGGGTILSTANAYNGVQIHDAVTKDAGRFIMYGGTITGAQYGVVVYDADSFAMYGGTITGNGVGVRVSSSIIVGGTVNITGNTKNVYLLGTGSENGVITIDPGLTQDARIGVTTEKAPGTDSSVKIAEGASGSLNYTGIFTPDVKGRNYVVARNDADELLLAVHVHDWQYALKDGTTDTITAVCNSGGCPNTDGGSVTIKAPEHTVYGDGKDQSVQIENTNWLPEYPANAVSYRKGEETIEAPTDAGSYTGVLTIGGVEATVDYTIGRKTVSAGDVTFSHTRTTYDGTQKNVADFLVVIVDGKTLTPGTDYVVFGTTSASDFEEEGYNARIALQGNYEGTVPFRWHIDPREAELELVNAADRRYGDGKGAVTLRVTNAVGNDRVSVTVTGGDDLSVGTHSVTATALDCPEYTLPADAAKRTLTYSVGKGKINRVNLTMDVYNNVAKKHTYDFAQALPALADGLTYGTCTYTGENNMNASVVSGIGFNGSVLTFNTGRIISKEGTSILWYTATVKSDNYEDIKLSLDVQTKDKTVADLPESDITMEGWSYGQTPNRPSVANLPAGVTPTFTYKDANGAEFTPAKTTDAGVYSVTVRYETEDTVYTGTRSFTVAPKTLTAEDIGEYGPSGIIPNKTYDSGTGIDLTGLGVKKAALVGTDENLIISGSAEFASANAGDTTLVFTTNGKLSKAPGTAVKASNYTIAEGLTKEFAAKINPRWLDFTVDSVSKRFGSPDSTADVRVTFTGVAGNSQSGLVSGETLEQGVDYDVRATFSQTAVGQDDGVVVTVTLKDTAKAKNYKLVSGSVATSGEIKKAAAPVISEQTVLVYSNAEKDYVVGLHVRWPSGTPAFSEYDTPLVEDTDLTEATAILRESFGGFKPSATAGDVAIDVHLKPFIAPVGTDLGIIKFVMKSANCEDAVVPVRFKVMAKTQRALSVSIENWTYGSTPSQPVYGAPGGTASGPDITYTSRDGQTSYGATAPTDAGDYTVTIRCESIDTIWSGSADFTISRKQITQPAADTTAFTYTADEQTYTLAASPDYTISDNTVQTNVGDYTIRVSLNDTANTEWTDGTTEEKAYTFTIDPAALTVTALDKEILVGQSAPDLSDPAEGTDYSVEGLLGADVLTGVTLTYGETPDTGRMGSYAIHAAAALANYDVACVSGTLTIRKAAAPVLADIPFSCKYTLTGEQTVDVSGLVPGAEGYTLGAAAGETAIVSGAAVDANGVVTYTLTGAGKAGDSVTLPVTISSAKYENAVVNVVITMLPRDEQAALRVTGGTTVVYGETLQLGTSGGSGTGAVTYAVTEINGKATIDANGLLTPVQVGSVTVTATKAGDDAYNDVTSAAVEITIRKAKPTGVPSYTPVTGRGKTLRDAALTIEGGSLSLKDGTLEWVDKDGNVLPDDTVIEAGKSYKWRFTPADGNYAAIDGETVLYSPAEDDIGHGNSHNYRTIMVTVRGNGSVSPSGWANVPIGGDQTFTITPDKGYAVAKVLIDGQSVGAVTSYTFQSVTEGHTIEVIFMKANGNPQTGVTVGQRTVG